ncbi:tyrosine-type recombinase/integrase [Candidatus Pacearchaeota archaeon]|nr:tyrosine-type recombinase/integrase [Candidatus Pacearchaeota archaeon]
MKNLEKHIANYLLWMVESRYSRTSVLQYKIILTNFKMFIYNKKKDEIFTYQTLIEFNEKTGLKLSSHVVKKFSEYLFKRGFIENPVKKPINVLPNIFEEYIYILDSVKKLSKVTINRTRVILTAFNEYLDVINIRLKTLQIEHIDTFLSKYNTDYARATCNNNRSILRGFLKYLYSSGITKRNLSNLLIGSTVFAQNKPPKFLRLKEIQQLFKSLNTTPKNLRRDAMVHIGLSLGLRPKEISQIELDNIMFEKREICILDRKNTTPTRLPLAETTILIIAAYILEERPKTNSRRLFINLCAPYKPVLAMTVTREIKLAMKKAGLSSSAYWLRHTYAQNLLEADIPIFKIKEMMGHDSLQTTRRYLHVHIKLMRKVLFNED